MPGPDRASPFIRKDSSSPGLSFFNFTHSQEEAHTKWHDVPPRMFRVLFAHSCPLACSSTAGGTFLQVFVPARMLQHGWGSIFAGFQKQEAHTNRGYGRKKDSLALCLKVGVGLLRLRQDAAGKFRGMFLRQDARPVHPFQRPLVLGLVGAVKDNGMGLVPGDVGVAGQFPFR